MKRIYQLFFLINFLCFAISCNKKISHDTALNYYVIVQSQTKDVTEKVKYFSIRLSQFSKQYSSFKKNIFYPQTYDSLKFDYHSLVSEIDKRMKIVDDLAFYKENFYLKTFAIQYIKDVRGVLVNDVYKLINLYKPASIADYKPRDIDKKFFMLRKSELITDCKALKKLSEIYRDQYRISDDELIKYNL